MTNLIILVLCLIIIVSYIFDISSKYTRIPQVILLIALGIGIQLLIKNTGLNVPNMRPVLPVMGTLGLIFIVMEASLDIKLQKNKIGLVLKSMSAALFLFIIFVAILTFVAVKFFGYSMVDALLNTIPLGIISSAVAIPSAINLNRDHKEFIVYESAISDIIGILVFDFILINQTSGGYDLLDFTVKGLITILLAVVTTIILALLLHKNKYHINYVIIMTSIVMVYVLAKLSHLPSLFLILVFGLALSNYRFAERTSLTKHIDFDKFKKDLDSFRTILSELTFLIRSFFFIIFGYYINAEGLFYPENIIIGIILTASIFLLRWLFFTFVLKFSNLSVILFAPRGLITILLFLSIPAASRIAVVNEEVITLVILLTMALMMIGNIYSKKETEKAPESEQPVSRAARP